MMKKYFLIIILIILEFTQFSYSAAAGKAIIQKLIKGENVNPDSSGLSKREWNELMTAFDLKGKLI